MKPRCLTSGKLILLLVAVCATLFTACNKPKVAQWQPFQPPGGHFFVELPSDPIADPAVTNDKEVVIKWHIVSTLSGISALSISYSQRGDTNTPAFLNPPAKLLESVRDHSVSDLGGDHLKERDKAIALKSPQGADVPGLEFQVAIKGGYFVRERIYLVGTRIYALMVVSGSSGLTSNDAERFFKSFRLLP